jgi:UDP-3-O-[3-hydroxymyristoyl] glucosamine N-acyltransferase
VTLTLEQIAKLSDGELEGDPETKITGAASLAEATVHEISFFNNPRYLAQLRKTRAAAVIVPCDFAEQIGVAVIRTSDPAKAFEQVVTKFAPPPIKFAPGIHPSAVIHPRAKLGDHISIQPLVVIEAGARFSQLREVTWIIEKRDFVDGRLCQRSRAGDFRFRITFEFSAG